MIINREEKVIMWGLGMILLILLIWEVSWYRQQLDNTNSRITTVEGQMMDMKADVSGVVVDMRKEVDRLIEAANDYYPPPVIKYKRVGP